MLAADHISAVKRSFESRAMPETEEGGLTVKS